MFFTLFHSLCFVKFLHNANEDIFSLRWHHLKRVIGMLVSYLKFYGCTWFVAPLSSGLVRMMILSAMQRDFIFYFECLLFYISFLFENSLLQCFWIIHSIFLFLAHHLWFWLIIFFSKQGTHTYYKLFFFWIFHHQVGEWMGGAIWKVPPIQSRRFSSVTWLFRSNLWICNNKISTMSFLMIFPNSMFIFLSPDFTNVVTVFFHFFPTISKIIVIFLIKWVSKLINLNI